MKKIVVSLSIIAAVAAVAIGATSALFSDTEKSTGNTFTAGSIDLKVDSQCYYSYEGNRSIAQAVNCIGNWGWDKGKDLVTGDKFFQFSDLKPGDWGENTISLHVDNNDAWACAQIDLKSDDENGITEPEKDLGDTAENGELKKFLSFAWWPDDGDNVLESDEVGKVYYQSPLTLDQMFSDSNTAHLTLADTNVNFFTGQKPNTDLTPLTGAQTYYIGAGWCFGEMKLAPVAQLNTNTPAQNPGFTCSGKNVTNIAQSDVITADLSFEVVQKRNNLEFDCPEYVVRN